MATPHEMLERLAHALAQPWWRRYPLRVGAPVICGVKGRGLRDDEYGPVYGYTHRQCRDLQRYIAGSVAAHAREIAIAAEEPYDYYTGDNK